MRKKNFLILTVALLATVTLQAVPPTPVNWSVIRSEGDAWDLDMTAGGSLIWGDFNNDGWIDAFANMGQDRVHLYQNNGDGSFTKVQDGSFQGLKRGYSVFVDYDNDGNLDLIVTGRINDSNGDPITIFYRNTGSENGYQYVKDDANSAIVPGLESGNDDRLGHMLAAVDIDNDGWVDLMVSGNIKSGSTHPLGASGTRLTAVYKNVKGTFALQKNNVDGASFEQLGGGSIHVGDFNNDGFADIVNVGKTASATGTALYKNNGNGTFTKLAYSTELAAVNSDSKCDIVFADMNGDGYDDMVEINKDAANIHLSNGDGTFTKHESTTTGLVKSEGANITVADVNNDGYNDIFTSGFTIPNYTAIFYNNGDNTFTVNQIVPGARPGTANFVDMTNDGNLDASYYGWSDVQAGKDYPNRFLKNELGAGVVSNTAPTVPSDFNVKYENGKVVLTWTAATDAETPASALRYNVYVKNKTTGEVYAYAPADLSTGKLKIGGGIIPLIAKTSFAINLSSGEYTLGVQAVDQANVASAFVTNDFALAPENMINWTVIKSEANWDLDMTAGGSLVWGDFNNDSWMDAFANMGNDRVHLYKNNGDGTFEKVQEGSFKGLKEGYSVFMDYNNDGYLDLVITGKADAESDKKMTVFYKNTGEEGGFAFEMDETNSAIIPGMISGSGDRVGHLLNAVDVDNDGWVDLVVNGNISGDHPMGLSTGRFTAVYKNDKGTFTLQKDNVDGGNFSQMAGGSIHAGDFNNDGYPDIVNIGYSDTDGYSSALYQNNGDGTFTKVAYDGLDKNEGCDIVFADMNGDGKDDMVEITNNVANIHVSNGDGTFTKHESATTGLVKSSGTNITVADVNNDGFNDIFTSGFNIPNFTSIFYNNGDNTFTVQKFASGARPGTANFVDMTNDGNLDASYYGWGNLQPGTDWPNRFLKNEQGDGIVSNTAPTVPSDFNVKYENGKVVLTWTAATDAETPASALRYNVYVKNKTTGEVYAYAPADLSTGKLKIGGGIIPLISKTSFTINLSSGEYTFGVQTVDQANVASAFVTNDFALAPENMVNWTVVRNEGEAWDLDMTAGGSLVWGDFNNDGWIDAFANMGNDRVHLYKNNGNGAFEKVQEGSFKGLKEGYSVFIDYNNDGYLDLVITGKADAESDKKMTVFYKNTGEEGGFAFETDDANSAIIPGMVSGDGDRVGHLLNAVDVDNDGWVDLVVNGNISGDHPMGLSTGRFTAVYKNDKGTFTLQKDNVDGGNFSQMAGGSVHAGDFNNDGYPDIVNIGYSDTDGYSSALYQNNGDGTFAKIAYNGLDKNERCDVVFADIDGDGKDDIIEITSNVANVHISNGDGTFTKQESAVTGLVKSEAANITVADVNNDGYNDIFTSGYNIPNFTAIYYNNGDNTFTAQEIKPGARPGTANFVDMTNDGNLDISYYGWSNGQWPNRFLKNDLGIGVVSNTAPSVPENLLVNYQNGKFSLSWDKSTDAETAQDALRYNVYARNSETGLIYVYAPADTVSGKLRIGGGIIPLIAKNSVELNLENANYIFGVQAVDQANVASAFITAAYVKTGICQPLMSGITVTPEGQNIVLQNETSENVSYSVITVSGVKIKNGVCQSTSQQTISGLNKGIYLVQVVQNKSVRTVKVAIL